MSAAPQNDPFAVVPVEALTRRSQRFACPILRGVFTARSCVARQVEAAGDPSFGRKLELEHCANCSLGKIIAAATTEDQPERAPQRKAWGRRGRPRHVETVVSDPRALVRSRIAAAAQNAALERALAARTAAPAHVETADLEEQLAEDPAAEPPTPEEPADAPELAPLGCGIDGCPWPVAHDGLCGLHRERLRGEPPPPALAPETSAPSDPPQEIQPDPLPAPPPAAEVSLEASAAAPGALADPPALPPEPAAPDPVTPPETPPMLTEESPTRAPSPPADPASGCPCGAQEIRARGLCVRCYDRARKKGELPPAPKPKGRCPYEIKPGKQCGQPPGRVLAGGIHATRPDRVAYCGPHRKVLLDRERAQEQRTAKAAPVRAAAKQTRPAQKPLRGERAREVLRAEALRGTGPVPPAEPAGSFHAEIQAGSVPYAPALPSSAPALPAALAPLVPALRLWELLGPAAPVLLEQQEALRAGR